MNLFMGFDSVPSPPPWDGAVVTIGVFDGVHRGHRALIERAVCLARAQGYSSMVLTFDRHPLETLRPEIAPRYIYTLSHRLKKLARLGVDHTLIIPFHPAFAAISAETFVEQSLVQTLRMKHLITGDDFQFGRDRQGNIALLQQLSEPLGYQLEVASNIQDTTNKRISSSLIRQAILAGQVEEAADLLGEAWHWSGVAVRGEGRGSELGYPTANLLPAARLLLPAEGVYACLARLQEGVFAAAVSVGLKPQFPDSPPTVEAYLLDFVSKPLYGQVVELQFLKRLREQWRFESLKQLTGQIEKDVEQTRQIAQSML